MLVRACFACYCYKTLREKQIMSRLALPGIFLLSKHFKITHQFCQMKKLHLLYLTVVKTILFFSDSENKALLNRLFLNFAEAVKTAHHMTNIQLVLFIPLSQDHSPAPFLLIQSQARKTGWVCLRKLE